MAHKKTVAIIKSLFYSKLFWLQLCTLGIWLLVFQSYFGRDEMAQRVYVVGGEMETHSYVSGGSIDTYVNGGYIRAQVEGNVSVDNTVPVKIQNVVTTKQYYRPLW